MLGQSRYSFPSPWLTCTKPFAASQLLWSRAQAGERPRTRHESNGDDHRDGSSGSHESGNCCESSIDRMSPGENVGRRAAAPRLEQQRGREQRQCIAAKKSLHTLLGSRKQGMGDEASRRLTLAELVCDSMNLVLEKHFYACRD